MKSTIIATLPMAQTYRGPLIITPQDRDIGVMVPRRWGWLDRLLGPRFYHLEVGQVLTATSNGHAWSVRK